MSECSGFLLLLRSVIYQSRLTSHLKSLAWDGTEAAAEEDCGRSSA